MPSVNINDEIRVQWTCPGSPSSAAATGALGGKLFISKSRICKPYLEPSHKRYIDCTSLDKAQDGEY
ncbi:hypothetical protein O3P69_006341 [Scylla paramamosain]|uniref:Uncharacterized protein n=1 Tax=Scylla paramamosain TaxID=85552 RepID=A0AAW0U564_SCYPA